MPPTWKHCCRAAESMRRGGQSLPLRPFRSSGLCTCVCRSIELLVQVVTVLAYMLVILAEHGAVRMPEKGSNRVGSLPFLIIRVANE
jgi:hypothetical protein